MTKAAAAKPAQLGDTMSAAWAERVQAELLGNILPFWPRHVLDRKSGGFHGTVRSDLTVLPNAPRSCVVNTRILWTYSAAARLQGIQWRETADWAKAYVTERFRDKLHGGLYWMLDAQGAPIADRKQTYAQAFGIYALSEYYRLSGDPASLELAKDLYRLIETHCYDPVHKGYWEARGRAWEPLADMRLSDRDLNCPKSMNTHLHVLEGYTNLLRVWPDEGLKAKQHELIEVMMDRIIDNATGHFRLFFDEQWKSLSDHMSYGHDIEGSWLLVEAADVLGDPSLMNRATKLAVLMANAVEKHGLDRDGSVFFEADGEGNLVDANKHWWVQAEAVIGFYNAYELTGEARFREASARAWEYIENFVVDRKHGEWHAKLSRDGIAFTEAEDPEATLVGPWKCPYHNARVCYEMLERLGRSKNK